MRPAPDGLIAYDYIPCPGRPVVCRRQGCLEEVAGEGFCELHLKEVREARAGVTTKRTAYSNQSLPLPQRTIRFPAQPLFDAVIKRFGSVANCDYKDQLSHYTTKGFDWVRADTWAAWLGLLPQDIWPDWYERTADIEEPPRGRRIGERKAS